MNLFLYHIHLRQKWFCDIGCAKRWGDRQCGHCQKNWAPGTLVKNSPKPPSAVNYDCQQSLSEIFACVKSKILQPWGRSKWADDIPWWSAEDGREVDPEEQTKSDHPWQVLWNRLEVNIIITMMMMAKLTLMMMTGLMLSGGLSTHSSTLPASHWCGTRPGFGTSLSAGLSASFSFLLFSLFFWGGGWCP